MKSPALVTFLTLLLLLLTEYAGTLSAQSLDEELQKTSSVDLAAQASREGDAVRGAILFFQQHMACSKCHAVGDENAAELGPNLAKIGKEATNESIVESIFGVVL